VCAIIVCPVLVVEVDSTARRGRVPHGSSGRLMSFLPPVAFWARVRACGASVAETLRLSWPCALQYKRNVNAFVCSCIKMLPRLCFDQIMLPRTTAEDRPLSALQSASLAM